ncbi:uncharacterized protein B0H64DRAFT_206028 [Chaetomium fimeti]|uniref:Uncharacterized protein n=1 Tax=Chaetomium fimeti TaxID=1854472 RepID=A0AAE0HB64_9PEZI|nr:hypothetical protein B0H64DRAFT_206028 [Chaetomium fimeti]
MPQPNPSQPHHTFTLSLITYDRGPHPLTNLPRPHHWAYFLDPPSPPPSSGVSGFDRGAGSETETSRGTVFQLRGMPGGFYYPGPEWLDVKDGGVVVGRLEVGEVRRHKVVGEGDGMDGGWDAMAGVVKMIDGVLRDVEVVEDENVAWNCQDWALEGLERLKGAGVVYEYLEREGVRAWLKER